MPFATKIAIEAGDFYRGPQFASELEVLEQVGVLYENSDNSYTRWNEVCREDNLVSPRSSNHSPLSSSGAGAI